MKRKVMLYVVILSMVLSSGCISSADNFKLCYSGQDTEYIVFASTKGRFYTHDYSAPFQACEGTTTCLFAPILFSVPPGRVNKYQNQL